MRNRQPYCWRNTIVSLFTRMTGTRWERLNYDTVVAAFAVGETATAGAASGVIVYLTDTTMYFASITGTFVDGAAITGDGSGSAAVNGTQY